VSSLPLAGRRVLVTRALHQAGKFSKEMRALGAEPVEVPVIEIGAPESYAAFDDAIRHLDRYDWLILTSTNTIQALCGRGRRFAVDPAKAEGRLRQHSVLGLGLQLCQMLTSPRA